MKSFIKLCLLISFSTLSAQSVSEYAFVNVPKKFKDFKTNNQYNLNNILAVHLGDKNYKIIKGEEGLSQLNPCSVLNAEVNNTSTMFRNRLTLVLKDCNGREVFKHQGTGDSKEFDLGYAEAMLQIIDKIPASTNTNNALPIATAELPKETKAAETEIKKELPTPKQQPTKAVTTEVKAQNETFTNKGNIYNKVSLSKGNFILNQGSVFFGAFTETTNFGMYRVKLADGTPTLAYEEGNNIVVELPNSDGTFRKEIFVKK